MTVDLETQRVWARAWQKAGKALEAVRRAELRGLTEERALTATSRLLSLGTQASLSAKRRRKSGLVVLKTFAGRDKDWIDVEGIVTRQGRCLDAALVVRELESLLDLRDDHALAALAAGDSQVNRARGLTSYRRRAGLGH